MLQLAETNRIDTNEFENGVVAYNEKFFKEFTGVKMNLQRFNFIDKHKSNEK